MNSGCYDNDISKVLLSIKTMDIKNYLKTEIKKEDINLITGEQTLSKNLIIISAKIKCLIGKRKEIEKKQIELIKRKKLSQPSQIKTCGSTFKNISDEQKAWM